MVAWRGLARARVTLGLLVASLAGCSTELPSPTTPDEALARGELYEALKLARERSPDDQLRVARALIEAVDPVIEVTPLPDEELVARAGAHAARALRRLAVVVRVTTTTKRPEGDAWRTLGPLQPSTEIALDGLSGSLQTHRTDGYSLAAFTGERYPTGRSETTWHSSQPLWKVDGPVSLAAAVVLFPVFGLALLPSSSTTTIPPAREEILASAPHADRLERALTSACEGATCSSYVVLRKPQDPGLTLDLALSFSLQSGPLVAHARAAFRLPAGDALEERIRVGGAKRRLAQAPGLTLDMRGGGASRSDCYPGMFVHDEPTELVCGVLHLGRNGATMPPLGLTVPAPTEHAGTMATSRAARPAWAKGEDERSAVRGMREAAPDRAGTWLQCELFAPVDKRGSSASTLRLALGDDKTALAGSDRPLGRFLSRPDVAVFPLLDVPPGGSLSLIAGAAGGAVFERIKLTRGPSGLIVADNTARATCLLADRAGVEAAFVGAWTEITDALDALAEAPVTVLPEEDDLGRAVRTKGLHAPVSRAAALVGWDDPRVRALLERLAREDARFAEAQREALEALAKEPDPKNPGRDHDVGAVSIGCDAKGTCTLSAAITNASTSRTYPSFDAILAFEDGSTLLTHLRGEPLEPGKSGVAKAEVEVAQRSPVAVVLRGFKLRVVRRLERSVAP